MLMLAPLRDWLKTLALQDWEWTIGRYEAEKERRVCVTGRTSYESTAALGGRSCTLTNHKSVNILVHGSRNARETEQAAAELFDALRFNPRAAVGGESLSYVELECAEPIDLGSDGNGIFERTVWASFYYQKEA